MSSYSGKTRLGNAPFLVLIIKEAMVKRPSALSFLMSVYFHRLANQRYRNDHSGAAQTIFTPCLYRQPASTIDEWNSIEQKQYEGVLLLQFVDVLIRLLLRFFRDFHGRILLLLVRSFSAHLPNNVESVSEHTCDVASSKATASNRIVCSWICKGLFKGTVFAVPSATRGGCKYEQE
jgi:hypothetical protein